MRAFVDDGCCRRRRSLFAGAIGQTIQFGVGFRDAQQQRTGLKRRPMPNGRALNREPIDARPVGGTQILDQHATRGQHLQQHVLARQAVERRAHLAVRAPAQPMAADVQLPPRQLDARWLQYLQMHADALHARSPNPSGRQRSA